MQDLHSLQEFTALAGNNEDAPKCALRKAFRLGARGIQALNLHVTLASRDQDEE